MNSSPSQPHARLSALAVAPSLLVACDFDGTVSPIVADPAAARIDPRCQAALDKLSTLPHTSIAFISGRPADWLRAATNALPDALLYGSHGAEQTHAPKRSRRRPDAGLVKSLSSQLRGLMPRWPGSHVEEKPFGAALHYRRVEKGESVASEVSDAARAIASGLVGVVVKLGSMVVELTTSSEHKGTAVKEAKRRAGAGHAVFFGDDITDEDAFASLDEQDVGVKVGPGETVAEARAAGLDEVAAMLEQLYATRKAWLDARRLEPLADHSMLSDYRTLAVVSPRGRVVWMCLPRVDSPAVFAELLDSARAGFFGIAPVGESGGGVPEQAYVDSTMTLRTRWNGGAERGGVDVLDYLDCSGARATQRAGRTDLVRVVSGKGKVKVTFVPRLDFGRFPTRLRAGVGECCWVEVLDAPDPLVLVGPPVKWSITRDKQGRHDSAEAEIDLDAFAGSVTLELRYGTRNSGPSRVAEPVRRARTEHEWTAWAKGLTLPPVHARLVERSALLLKGLTYGPTGALLAAGTTSLPEQLGGVRNWDYRFCWPRDAALAATALIRLGSSGEAMRLAEWLVGVVDTLDSPERLRPLYTVTGQELPAEAEIGDLAGYGGSRPVRVSNAAATQVQLDVFGPIADMLATLAESGVPVSPDYWRLTRAIVSAVEARWEEPDHGIWEIRGPKRHHVHSRLMCWHAVDRALVVHRAVVGGSNARWERLREVIAADILEKGWNERVQAFTVAYEHEEMDATGLLVGLTGLIGVNDPRWGKTVDAVRRELQRGRPPGPCTLLRYLGDDGLPGREGGFLICTCWLVEALITLGRVGEARAVLDSVAAQAGRTGTFTEQYDVPTSSTLGNFPQAYSHLGFINAAVRLAAAEGGRA